ADRRGYDGECGTAARLRQRRQLGCQQPTYGVFQTRAVENADLKNSVRSFANEMTSSWIGAGMLARLRAFPDARARDGRGGIGLRARPRLGRLERLAEEIGGDSRRTAFQFLDNLSANASV